MMVVMFMDSSLMEQDGMKRIDASMKVYQKSYNTKYLIYGFYQVKRRKTGILTPLYYFRLNIRFMNVQCIRLQEEQELSQPLVTQPISSFPYTYPSRQITILIIGLRGEWQCFAKLMIE